MTMGLGYQTAKHQLENPPEPRAQGGGARTGRAVVPYWATPEETRCARSVG